MIQMVIFNVMNLVAVVCVAASTLPNSKQIKHYRDQVVSVGTVKTNEPYVFRMVLDEVMSTDEVTMGVDWSRYGAIQLRRPKEFFNNMLEVSVDSHGMPEGVSELVVPVSTAKGRVALHMVVETVPFSAIPVPRMAIDENHRIQPWSAVLPRGEWTGAVLVPALDGVSLRSTLDGRSITGEIELLDPGAGSELKIESAKIMLYTKDGQTDFISIQVARRRGAPAPTN